MTFGERLRALREAAGLSQEALARAADLSTSTVSKMEQKAIDPAWSTVQAVARALGVSCEAFQETAGQDVESPPARGKGASSQAETVEPSPGRPRNAAEAEGKAAGKAAGKLASKGRGKKGKGE